MSIEPIIALEDSIDSLEHTRHCITEALVDGKRCRCGIQDLRDAIEKYRNSVWRENRAT